MLTLHSYPGLFGVADNNPFGLKVFAAMRLGRLAFRHVHIFDASQAPRGQLPYLTDGAETVGDSEVIIAHLEAHRGLALDTALTPAQRALRHLVVRTLDDLYWVMSYSRWQDERYWPQFRDAVLAQHPSVTPEAMAAARAYNAQRYHYQGIGRFTPEQAYARGIGDLETIGAQLPAEGFVFGTVPCSLDAAIYGFVANIRFYPIGTPLRAWVLGHPALLRHCDAIHAAIA